ncbi:hypothetical protein L226DRAFT_518152 [Lentinus tigrinus ALCF2SS1-7]|uniref:uncharacterized protein n=1 Tax=Lentinus tigrinus ALCF2SS1-7 TaxID=1328758 RepID=UPI00116623CA|nr:hypothetical protein L226DRAFT_518152 [Lentinus tigrinus ALCF2SS1-7]
MACVDTAAAASWLASRLHNMQMHIPAPPNFANEAFHRVAANILFSLGDRGRSYLSETSDRSRADGAHVVSKQASPVLQKGIGRRESAVGCGRRVGGFGLLAPSLTLDFLVM